MAALNGTDRLEKLPVPFKPKMGEDWVGLGTIKAQVNVRGRGESGSA